MTLDLLKSYLRWKFPDRDKAPDYEYVNLFTALQEYGPRSFQELDEMVEKNIEWVLDHEKHIPDILHHLFSRWDGGVIVSILLERVRKDGLSRYQK